MNAKGKKRASLAQRAAAYWRLAHKSVYEWVNVEQSWLSGYRACQRDQRAKKEKA